jgi:hypothetical protein
MELVHYISEGLLLHSCIVSYPYMRSRQVRCEGSAVEEISCAGMSGLADLCYKRKDPLERTATVTAPAAIEIGRVLDVAQREAQDIATSIAAAVSQRNV